jgi:hypothetical protein
MPLPTATREHAELMTPLPPMNSTLSLVIPVTISAKTHEYDNRDSTGTLTR